MSHHLPLSFHTNPDSLYLWNPVLRARSCTSQVVGTIGALIHVCRTKALAIQHDTGLLIHANVDRILGAPIACKHHIHPAPPGPDFGLNHPFHPSRLIRRPNSWCRPIRLQLRSHFWILLVLPSIRMGTEPSGAP